MKTFLSQIILPLPIFGGLFIVGYIFRKTKYKRTSRFILVLAFLELIIVATPFVPTWMVKQLEKQNPVFNVSNIKLTDRAVHILVLGGGHSNDTRLPATGQLSTTALSRLTEGIRIYRQIPESILVTSGGSGKEPIPQATVLARAAILLGVNPAQIQQQTLPQNTWEEAKEYKRINGDSTQLILVTSAIHMPRAMYLFKKAGLNPIAAPTNYYVKHTQRHNIWSKLLSTRNLEKTECAIHEYVGLFWEKLMLKSKRKFYNSDFHQIN